MLLPQPKPKPTTKPVRGTTGGLHGTNDNVEEMRPARNSDWPFSCALRLPFVHRNPFTWRQQKGKAGEPSALPLHGMSSGSLCSVTGGDGEQVPHYQVIASTSAIKHRQASELIRPALPFSYPRLVQHRSLYLVGPHVAGASVVQDATLMIST